MELYARASPAPPRPIGPRGCRRHTHHNWRSRSDPPPATTVIGLWRPSGSTGVGHGHPLAGSLPRNGCGGCAMPRTPSIQGPPLSPPAPYCLPPARLQPLGGGGGGDGVAAQDARGRPTPAAAGDSHQAAPAARCARHLGLPPDGGTCTRVGGAAGEGAFWYPGCAPAATALPGPWPSPALPPPAAGAEGQPTQRPVHGSSMQPAAGLAVRESAPRASQPAAAGPAD